MRNGCISLCQRGNAWTFWASLFERVGKADSCQPGKRAENGRLSAYDAYNCLKTSFRGGAISESLGAQACIEPEKVENEKYAVSVYNKDGIQNYWSIYDKTSDKYYRFDPWGILYSGFDSSIYSKIVGAFSEGAITQGQVGIIEKWEEWLEKKGVEFKASTIEWDIEKS